LSFFILIFSICLDFPLYIIIHNIDGVCLRDSEIQYRLSELASIENIHIIASIDHINSALLWDHVQLISFKWIYYDLSTFKSYNEEIMFENSLMINQTGNVQLSSLIHVLKSLTTNAKNIFIIMSEHALNADKTKRSKRI
jgi:origin recognition complex subunit 2